MREKFFIELLKKYIKHVKDCEGAHFINNWSPYGPFTEEESKILNSLADQIELENAE